MITPGQARSATSIVAELTALETTANAIAVSRVRPGSIKAEVLLAEEVTQQICWAGEDADVQVDFVTGNTATSWTEIVALKAGAPTSGYGNAVGSMTAVDFATLGAHAGVIVEFDVLVREITSWSGVAYSTHHAFGPFVVELRLEVCDEGTKTDWFPVAGPFYVRGNAVLLEQASATYPCTKDQFDTDGANDPNCWHTVARACRIDKTRLRTVTSRTNDELHGVRVRARGWCNSTDFANIQTNIRDLAPTVPYVPYFVIDAGSRISLEQQNAGVLS